MEILIILACSLLIFLSWQLYQAKRITHFKQWIDKELTPELTTKLTECLQKSRCATFQNNDVHIQASIYFWTQYRARVIQKALQLNIINKQTIIDMKYHRQCQHMLFIENEYLLPEEMLIPVDESINIEGVTEKVKETK